MKLTKILVIIFFCSATSTLFADFIPQASTPENAINNLYYTYKTQDYSKGVNYTTGKMNQAFNSMISLQKKMSGRLPANLSTFSNTLEKYIILGAAKKDNKAEVSLFWISRLPNGHSSPNTHLKITYVNYLLEKIAGQWKTKDAHFNNEYILYNKEDIKNIYKKMQEN